MPHFPNLFHDIQSCGILKTARQSSVCFIFIIFTYFFQWMGSLNRVLWCLYSLNHSFNANSTYFGVLMNNISFRGWKCWFCIRFQNNIFLYRQYLHNKKNNNCTFASFLACRFCFLASCLLGLVALYCFPPSVPALVLSSALSTESFFLIPWAWFGLGG